jgi:hypothetical protein
MKGHASVRRNLPLASVAARFLFVAFVVFATFNPTYYSISTWMLSGFSFLSIKAFLCFGLGLAWLILLRISLAGLGGLGAGYIALASLMLALFEVQFGVSRSLSTWALVLMAELGLTVVITFGLVFSYWVRQASGQSPVVKTPP